MLFGSLKKYLSVWHVVPRCYFYCCFLRLLFLLFKNYKSVKSGVVYTKLIRRQRSDSGQVQKRPCLLSASNMFHFSKRLPKPMFTNAQCIVTVIISKTNQHKFHFLQTLVIWKTNV